MDAPSQNLPDHGYAFFHSDMLALHDAANFIEHFDCTLIVVDEQSLQDFLEIINPLLPRSTLQCRVSSNFVYEIVDDIAHGCCTAPKDLLRRWQLYIIVKKGQLEDAPLLSEELKVAEHNLPVNVREGDAVKEVPAGLSVFRIDDDGRLQFARKYDIDVSDKTMFWMGMVPL